MTGAALKLALVMMAQQLQHCKQGRSLSATAIGKLVLTRSQVHIGHKVVISSQQSYCTCHVSPH